MDTDGQYANLAQLEVLKYWNAIKSRQEFDMLFYDKRGFFIGSRKVEEKVLHYKLSVHGEILIVTDKFHSIHYPHVPERLFFEIDSGLYYSDGRKIFLTGSMDDNFNEIIPPVYSFLRDLDSTFVRAAHNNLCGIINKDNILIIKVSYKDIEHKAGSECFVCEREAGFDIIDYQGNILSELNYTKVYVSNRLITTFNVNDPEQMEYEDLMKPEGKYGLVDLYGRELIPTIYSSLKYSPGYGYAALMIGELRKNFEVDSCYDGSDTYYEATGGLWGLSNLKHQILIPFEYQWIEYTKNKEYWLVNKGGTMYYQKDYQDDGYWHVKGGKWGLVNSNNKIIVPIGYDMVETRDEEIRFKDSDTASTKNPPVSFKII